MADFNGDGKTDISLYRPSTGQWLVKGILDTVYGASTDAALPLPVAIRRAVLLP